jgi:hypothetical protein
VAFSYQIDVARQLVISTASGVVTAEEILNHQRQLQNDPAFEPQFSQLVDLTPATKTAIHAADVRLFAARTIFGPQSRRAFVAGGPVAFGLARMFELMRDKSGDQGIRVFQSHDEALRWLNIR